MHSTESVVVPVVVHGPSKVDRFGGLVCRIPVVLLVPRNEVIQLMSVLTIGLQLRAVRRASFGKVAAANEGLVWPMPSPVSWACSASAKVRKMNHRKGLGNCLLYIAVNE
jgi:hypothetical protein